MSLLGHGPVRWAQDAEGLARSPLPQEHPLRAQPPADLGLGERRQSPEGGDPPPAEDFRLRGRRVRERKGQRRQEIPGIPDNEDGLRAPRGVRGEERRRAGPDPGRQPRPRQLDGDKPHERLRARRIRAPEIDGAASAAGRLDARRERECRAKEEPVGLDLRRGIAPPEDDPGAAGHRERRRKPRHNAAGLRGSRGHAGLAPLARHQRHRLPAKLRIAPAQGVQGEVGHR